MIRGRLRTELGGVDGSAGQGASSMRRQVASVRPVAELRRGRVRMTYVNPVPGAGLSLSRRCHGEANAVPATSSLAGCDFARDAPPVDVSIQSIPAHLALRRRGYVGVDITRACAAGNRRASRERAANGWRVQIEIGRRAVQEAICSTAKGSHRSCADSPKDGQLRASVQNDRGAG